MVYKLFIPFTPYSYNKPINHIYLSITQISCQDHKLAKQFKADFIDQSIGLCLANNFFCISHQKQLPYSFTVPQKTTN